MTWEDLKTFMDIPDSDTSNDTRIEACWDNAGDLLTLALAKSFRVMPQGLQDECRLKMGKDLYDSRNTTAGNSQFTTFDGPIPARAARDPYASVRLILAQYVVRY